MKSSTRCKAEDVREIGPGDVDPQDIEACLQIFDTNVPRYFTAAERDEFQTFLESLPGPYYMLPLDDGVAACGGYAVTPETGVADLCWGMVRQDLHGQGIGRMLTELRVRRALDDPAGRRVALNTSQHTVGFYERLGFRTTKVTPDGFGPGLDRCDMVMDVPDR